MQALDAEQLDEAYELLGTLRSDYPQTRQGQQAALERAYVSYRLGRYREAIEQVERFAAERPDAATDDIRYALMLRASAAHALWEGESDPPDTALARTAFAYYRQIVERFPEDEQARRALRHMSELRRDLAAEELRRARERYAANDFVEAAERAAWIAEQYPGLQQAGDALALQVAALEQLGRGREAAATRRMLEIKHPDHPALEALRDSRR